MHGHAEPSIARAIAEQAGRLEQVIFADFTHEPAVRLAARLAGVLPADDARVPFLLDAAQRHYAAALPLLSEEDYQRAHWLASFAVYALTE